MKEKYREEFLKKISKSLQRRHEINASNRLKQNSNIKTFQAISSLNRRPDRVYKNSSSSSIFISGGIGDFIAVESFMTDEERSKINKIYYATHKKESIESIVKSLPNMNHIKMHEVIWDDFSKFWCFFSKEECINKMKSIGRTIPIDLELAEDFSISKKFKQFSEIEIVYNESSLLKYNLADISKFILPEFYLVICPYSTDKRIKDRDFNSCDWNELINWIKKLGIQGVVLNYGQDFIPECPEIINLSNNTTIQESIEILKKSIGYIGIDSSMSVVASKLFNKNILNIKSVNDHCYKWSKCYYAPNTEFNFLKKSIKSPDKIEQFIPSSNDVKSITLNVCQGVGDIFWVYQKFAPHFDEINFCITHVSSGAKKIQHRANNFLRLLPKIKNISFRVVSSQIYDKLASSRFSMKEIMEKYQEGERIFDYACNYPLEQGIRIEEIDSNYKIEESTNIVSENYPLQFNSKEYVVVYVSGTTMQTDVVEKLKLWNPKKWAEFVDGFCKKYNMKKNIVFIGASYDLEASNTTCEFLSELKYKTSIVIDSNPANVINILKNSQSFIGYQSGLNIIADNLDVKQVMIYFPYLKNMLYTWCKKKNIGNTFFASTFDKNIEDVLNEINLEF